jgi:general secretion pathway protein J
VRGRAEIAKRESRNEGRQTDIAFGDSKGFTLIELLTSVALLVVVVTMVAGTMRLGYRSVETGERRIEAVERLRRSMSVIDAQIQSSMPLAFEQQGDRKSYFRGDRRSLRFVTNHSLWRGRNGYAVVSYQVEPNAWGRLTLLVSENPVGLAVTAQTRLLVDCDDIEFYYFRKRVAGEEARWVEQWTDDVLTPEKIWFHVRQKGWDSSLIIPVRVTGAGA